MKATHIDRPTSALLIGGLEVDPKKCHLNAITVLRSHRELQDRLQYVEGFCSGGAQGGNKYTGGQHSWLMLDDAIIEVTPGYEDTNVDDYFPVRFWKWRTAASRYGDENAGTIWHGKNRRMITAMKAAMARYAQSR